MSLLWTKLAAENRSCRCLVVPYQCELDAQLGFRQALQTFGPVRLNLPTVCWCKRASLRAVYTHATSAGADRRSLVTALYRTSRLVPRNTRTTVLHHFAYARFSGNRIVSTPYFRFLVGTPIVQSVGRRKLCGRCALSMLCSQASKRRFETVVSSLKPSK